MVASRQSTRHAASAAVTAFRRRRRPAAAAHLNFGSTPLRHHHPSPAAVPHPKISATQRTNLIFGANTDVGKTIVAAGLVRASLAAAGRRPENNKDEPAVVRYCKPLQCGGSDQAFVERHVSPDDVTNLSAATLFRWATPVSPHVASLSEHQPCSDEQVLSALQAFLSDISHSTTTTTSSSSISSSGRTSCTTYIETAGGVLSPSAASPDNTGLQHVQTQHALDGRHWGWTLQGDLYQPILGYAPVVLVGDGRLGGISSTLSALESLVLRGYDVAALVLIETVASYGNINALREYVSSRRMRSGSGEILFPTPSQSMLSLPPIPVDPKTPLHDWYRSKQVEETFARLDDHLQNSWEGQVSDWQSMLQAGDGRVNAVWWPGNNSTDSNGNELVTLVDSAAGNTFHVVQSGTATNTTNGLERVSMVDASASGWTQGVGHGASSMTLAVAAAAGRYGHVTAPPRGRATVMHAPAVALAQALVGPTGPGSPWADRVFFTDDGGSAAVEVAIKMGFKTYQKRMGLSSEEAEKIEWIVSAQEDCYHGDTLGAMNIAEPYTDKEHPWYEQKSLCLATPTLGFREGKLLISFPEGLNPSDDVAYEFDSIAHVMDIRARSLTKLLSLYKEMIEMQWLVHEHRSQQKIGSVILEPVMQCAGGMKFVDPLWQRAMVEVAKSRNIPVIFDESTTGLFRLGFASCSEILNAEPDIAIYSKLLTGGLLPLSVTLTSEEVFETFSMEELQQQLLNGNTFVASPVACVSALKALSSYHSHMKHEMNATSRDLGPRLLFDEEQTKRFSRLPCVEQSFTLGTVLSLTLRQDDEGATISNAGRIMDTLEDKGILAGYVDNVVYIMASPLTKKEECARVADLLYMSIQQLVEE